jgi:hypothetical protein
MRCGAASASKLGAYSEGPDLCCAVLASRPGSAPQPRGARVAAELAREGGGPGLWGALKVAAIALNSPCPTGSIALEPLRHKDIVHFTRRVD